MAVTHGAGNFYIGLTADTYGEIQSYTENESVQTDEALDSGGNVFVIANRDKKVEVTMEVVTNAGLPTSGDTLELHGKNTGNINVTSVSLTESNTDHQKATITGTSYITNGIPT